MILTIEGVDNSGKSTQAAMLVKWMECLGYKAKLFSFPDYTTYTGMRIREHLKSGDADPKTLHTLMAENRREKLPEILQTGPQTHMVMARYCESNTVYGMANGLSRRWLERLDRKMPKSDAVILLDGAGLQSRRHGGDVFETDSVLMARVADGYRREAKRNGWYVVTGDMDIDSTHEAVVGYARMAITHGGGWKAAWPKQAACSGI